MVVTYKSTSGDLVRLAIQYFERAARSEDPELRAKLRQLAEEYRDEALQMLDRAISTPLPSSRPTRRMGS